MHSLCLFQNLEGFYHRVFNIRNQSLSQTLLLNNFVYYFIFIPMCIIFCLVLNKFYTASTTVSANIMQFSVILCAFPLTWPAIIQKYKFPPHTGIFL